MSLGELHCRGNAVTDFTPVAGCPLELLSCPGIDGSHLQPLQGTPLKTLAYDLLLFHEPDEQRVRKFRLTSFSRYVHSFFDQKPIEAFWQEVADRREATRAFVAQVEKLPAGEQLEAVEKRLRELNPNFTEALGRTIRDGQVQEVHLPIDNVTDITPLRALTGLRRLKLANVNPHTPFDRESLTDLSPLNSLPLEELDCDEWLVRRNRAVFKEMPALRQVNGQPVE